MSNINRLTPEQEAFATHVGGVFVHACPGAGKTRTIIARLVKLVVTLPPRRGIAVLSFTNSAIDEFLERCQAIGLYSILKYPSFIGTLDAFIRNFLVIPSYYSPTSEVRPIILDSWDTLGIEVRLSGVYAFKGKGVSLDLFDPETNTIEPSKIEHNDLKNHVQKNQCQYQRRAKELRYNLRQKGYMSINDARAQILRLISDPLNSEMLGRALSARFIEVIVDEGQDCNPVDLQVLSWLKAYGIHITFVCDPDQVIYEFRNGNTKSIQDFMETYPTQSHLRLTGNFRSSPMVCRLAATLKNNAQVDQSVGDTMDVKYPVLFLTYEGKIPTKKIGQAFIKQIIEFGEDSTDAIILAHSFKYAQHAVGIKPNNSNGNSRIELLARNIADFWSPTATVRLKEKVLEVVETMLLDLMNLRQSNEHLLRAIERLGIDRRSHQRLAVNLLMNIPRKCGDTENDYLAWIESVYKEIERLNLQLPVGVTVRKFFRKPKNFTWYKHLQSPLNLGLACSTIHEAKGREYGAVCVVIPPNRAPGNRSEALLKSWETRIEAEAKRVIYVGLTRAKKMISLAVPRDFANRFISLLSSAQVEYIRKDL